MEEEVATKRCPKCKGVKAYSEFHKDRSKPKGINTYCSKCSKLIRMKRIKEQEKFAVFKAAMGKLRKTPEYREKEKIKARNKQRRLSAELADKYIRQELGIPNPPPELIELKRQQLLMHRATKQLKKEIQNVTN